MRLLDQIASSEAAAAGMLAAHNSFHFAKVASRQSSRARKVAAWSLLLVNAAIAAEAALYLAFLPAGASTLEGTAIVAVRSLILAAVAAISALVLRQHPRRPDGPR
jgi:hypothetical protein